MEDLPQVKSGARRPLRPLHIDIPDYLHDHRIEDRSVYPAVESLQRLAEAVLREDPGRRVLDSTGAEFLRFLDIPTGEAGMEAVADFTRGEGGTVTAALGTRARTARGLLPRVRDHVRVTFADLPPLRPLPLEEAAAPEGVCLPVPAEKLYSELVPFGPAFRNASSVLLFPGGAVAALRAPALGPANPPLGSPFVLDAAFHAACAWGERYRGCVAFPVGYARRSILDPARAGEEYFCRVVPRGGEGGMLLFDLWVYGRDGGLREAALGVRMTDVFKDRMAVPDWVRAPEGDPLRAVRERCLGMSVVETAGLAPFADRTFTPREAAEGARRRAAKRPQFTAARVALKRLARVLYGGAPEDPALIETIAPDGSRPACAPRGVAPGHFVSASHDDRFAVAAGARTPIGVDVERVSDKALAATHLYMGPAEEDLCARSPLGRREAAIRTWSAKECAAKAMDVPLVRAWSRAEMAEVGEGRSLVRIDGRMVEAVHSAVEGHIVTVLVLPAP